MDVADFEVNGFPKHNQKKREQASVKKEDTSAGISSGMSTERNSSENVMFSKQADSSSPQADANTVQMYSIAKELELSRVWERQLTPSEYQIFKQTLSSLNAWEQFYRYEKLIGDANAVSHNKSAMRTLCFKARMVLCGHIMDESFRGHVNDNEASTVVTKQIFGTTDAM